MNADYSPIELEVIKNVTELMTTYVSAYVKSDRDHFGACFHSELCTAVGNKFMSNSDLKNQPRSKQHYFELRKGHWSPPIRTQITVEPINEVVAMAKVRWLFPPTSTGIQYQTISMYLCAKTEKRWKIKMVTLPSENGEKMVTKNATYHVWDIKKWPIFKKE